MHEFVSVEAQLDRFFELLSSPLGMLGIIMFLLLLVAVTLMDSLKWPVLSLALFAASLGYSSIEWSQARLFFPLEQIRPHGRAMAGALLVALLVPTIRASRGWRIRLLVGGLYGLLALQLMFSMRVAMADQLLRGVTGAGLFVLFFLVLGVGLARWLQTPQDVHRALGAVVGAAALIVLGTCYQLALNPAAIVGRGRLIGITPNPQYAAMVFAFSLPAACFLLVRPGQSKWMRLSLSGLVGLLIVFLIWTGSRTGLLMSVVGLGLLFRSHVLRLAAAGLVIALVVWVGLGVFREAGGIADRLISVQDTRSHVWRMLVEQFFENPLFGVVFERVEIEESSYLSIAARMGIVGLIPLILGMLSVGWSLLRLERYRRWHREHSLLANLLIGTLLQVALAAQSEGILLGMLTFHVLILYVFLGVLGYTLDLIEQSEQEGMVLGAEAPLPEMAWSEAMVEGGQL